MTDNKYYNCPALMSDGRFMTDYRPISITNQRISRSHDIYDNNDFRIFLQKNGIKMMRNEFNKFKRDNACVIPVRCSLGSMCENYTSK